MSADVEQESELQVSKEFSSSPWYKDIVYVLQNLQASSALSRTKARSIKLKATIFCIMNKYLYGRDPWGIFLNCCLNEKPKS